MVFCVKKLINLLLIGLFTFNCFSMNTDHRKQLFASKYQKNVEKRDSFILSKLKQTVVFCKNHFITLFLILFIIGSYYTFDQHLQSEKQFTTQTQNKIIKQAIDNQNIAIDMFMKEYIKKSKDSWVQFIPIIGTMYVSSLEGIAQAEMSEKLQELNFKLYQLPYSSSLSALNESLKKSGARGMFALKGAIAAGLMLPVFILFKTGINTPIPFEVMGVFCGLSVYFISTIAYWLWIE